jgi:hypothetical protein
VTTLVTNEPSIKERYHLSKLIVRDAVWAPHYRHRHCGSHRVTRFWRGFRWDSNRALLQECERRVRSGSRVSTRGLTPTKLIALLAFHLLQELKLRGHVIRSDWLELTIGPFFIGEGFPKRSTSWSFSVEVGGLISTVGAIKIPQTLAGENL